MLTALLLAATVNTYVSERCGFSFEYPAAWTVVENPKAQVKDPGQYKTIAKCAVGLRPPHWPRAFQVDKDFYDLAPYPVRVTKWNRGLKASATATFFFQVRDLGDEAPRRFHDMNPWDWGIIARQSDLPARTFVTACCQGVRGSSWSHGYTRNYEKTGEKVTLMWEAAVVNDRKGHSVVIESDQDEGFRAVVTQIIESVRFHSSRSTP